MLFICPDLRTFSAYVFRFQILCFLFNDLIRQIFRFLFNDLIRQVFRFLFDDLICRGFRFLLDDPIFQIFRFLSDDLIFQIFLLRRSLPARKDIFQAHLPGYLVIICDLHSIVYDFCFLIDNICFCICGFCFCFFFLFREKFFRIFKCDFFGFSQIDLFRNNFCHLSGCCNSLFLLLCYLGNNINIGHGLNFADLFCQVIQHRLFFLFRQDLFFRMEELFQRLPERHCIADLLFLRLCVCGILTAVSIILPDPLFRDRFCSVRADLLISDILCFLNFLCIDNIVLFLSIPAF